jgi:hypothetical protein
MAKAELHMSIVIKTGADQGRKPQVRYMSGARFEEDLQSTVCTGTC